MNKVRLLDLDGSGKGGAVKTRGEDISVVMEAESQRCSNGRPRLFHFNVGIKESKMEFDVADC